MGIVLSISCSYRNLICTEALYGTGICNFIVGCGQVVHVDQLNGAGSTWKSGALSSAVSDFLQLCLRPFRKQARNYRANVAGDRVGRPAVSIQVNGLLWRRSGVFTTHCHWVNCTFLLSLRLCGLVYSSLQNGKMEWEFQRKLLSQMFY